MSDEKHEYLGDGVYASYDGYQIWLRLGSHTSERLVALDPQVMLALRNYAIKVGALDDTK